MFNFLQSMSATEHGESCAPRNFSKRNQSLNRGTGAGIAVAMKCRKDRAKGECTPGPIWRKQDVTSGPRVRKVKCRFQPSAIRPCRQILEPRPEYNGRKDLSVHIEPGIVTGAKLVLSYATGIATGCVVAELVVETIREPGALSFAMQAIAAMRLVFTFFEILPHFAVGVSEVHFVLGSTLFLLFGAAPAAFGLALGLLLQGVLFVPTDLPQYGMNVTTLLVPLFAIQALAKRLIHPRPPIAICSTVRRLRSRLRINLLSLSGSRFGRSMARASAPPTSLTSHRSQFPMQSWPWSSRWLIWPCWRSRNKLGGVSARGSVAHRS